MKNRDENWVKVAGVGLVCAVLGFAGGYAFIHASEPDVEPAPVAWETPPAPSEVTPVEVTPQADPELEARALAAEGRVQTLEVELAAAREDARMLREGQAADTAAVARADSRVSRLERDLASARTDLESARLERGVAQAALRVREQELTVARREIRRHQDASTANLWHAFTNDAAVELCDRGTRANRERCREELDAYFDDQTFALFEWCVEEQSTIPFIAQPDRGMDMPANSDRLPVKAGALQPDWYVLYCDGSLPDGAEEALASGPAPIYYAAP